jgi:hypothetical protein
MAHTPKLRIDVRNLAATRLDGTPHFTASRLSEAASSYLRAGLSFIPIRGDGTKMPAFELLPLVPDKQGDLRRRWSVYRRRLPSRREVKAWFNGTSLSYCPGIAILAGEASQNLEILDFDHADYFTLWQHRIMDSNPGLLDKIVWVRTPRPGVHGYYRCQTIGGSQKLARRIAVNPVTGKHEAKVTIELKGEGGYCLAPPSPGCCHSTGRSYRFITHRDLTAIVEISEEDRQLMLDTARQFDELRQFQSAKPRPKSAASLSKAMGTRPSDIFNAKVTWPEILEPKGWSFVGEGSNGCEYWCRPGKGEGTSASVNHDGSDLLYVFSSNAEPLDEERAYTKFAAYSSLYHNDDWRAAAQQMTADFQQLDPSVHLGGPARLDDFLD